MRYLGVDFGTKRVGLALSDEAGTMGFPHTVLQNDAKLEETISTLIRKENVGALVVGASHDFSGKNNPVATFAKAFADAVGKTSGIPVFFESEWLTTQEALRMPEGERMKKTETTDASAAALILTSFLSHHHD